MSIEVSGQEYAFEPKTKRGKTVGNATMDSDWLRKLTRKKPVAVARPGTPVAPTKRHTWFYNPLHDMESIDWLLLYFLGNKDIRCVPLSKARVKVEKTFTFRPESARGRNRRIFYHYLFARTLFGDRSKREGMMLVDKRLPNHLHDHPLHPSISPLAAPLLTIHDALVSRYRQVEKNPAKINGTCADGLHDVFSENIYAMMTHVESTMQRITVHSLSEAVFGLPKSYLDQLVGDSDGDSLQSGEEEYITLTGLKRAHADMESDEDSYEDEDEGTDDGEAPTKVLRTGSVSVSPPPSGPPKQSRGKDPTASSRSRRNNAASRQPPTERKGVPAPTRVLRSALRSQDEPTATRLQTTSPAAAAPAQKTASARKGKARAGH